MDTKKQINIAICVFCIMVLICVIVYITQTREENVEDLNIVVYKYDEETETYYPCGLSTEDALTIKKEIQKAKLLTEKEQAEATQINGNYKIMYGENDNDFVAFDNDEDNILYVGKQARLYSFSSKMYNIAINTCN